MLFSSIIFLIYFLPITFILVISSSFISNSTNKRIQNIILLIMSLLFYAWGEPLYIFLMIGSIIMNYALGVIIGNSNDYIIKKSTLTLSIFLNIGVLLIFKYSDMLVDIFNNITPFSNYHLKNPEIRLPIGISFFTFQAMSYVIDVYRKEVPPQRNLLDLGLYISFFPQLIAGPIVRYHDINIQLNTRTSKIDDIYIGLKRFILGLSKKVLIANVVAEVADEIFSLGVLDLSTGIAWIGIISYTLQIFFDFSGYSDMAIGLGRIFGFHFLENFNYPYISKGIQEFWRRWHISLSSWFRDYLYIPLGGSKKGKLRTYLNQIVVFFLCGLWHGASWTFVLWGLYHGLFLTLEKLLYKKIFSKIPSFILHIYTMLVVMIGWVFFRVENLIKGRIYIKALFGMSEVSNNYIWKYLGDRKFISIALIGIILSTPIIPNLKKLFIKEIKLPDFSIDERYLVLIKAFIKYVVFLSIIIFITFPRLNINTNTIITINSNSTKNQVFYTSGKNRYNEKDSSIFKSSVVEIPPIDSLNLIRLDAFLKNGNVWEIKNIEIEYLNSHLNIKGSELLNAITKRSRHLEEPIIDDSGKIKMKVTGNDPYFTLDLGYPLSEFTAFNKGVDKLFLYKLSWIIMSILLIVILLIRYIKKFMGLKKIDNSLRYNVSFSNIILYTTTLLVITFLLLWSVGSLAANTYNPFIYFRF